MGPQGHALDGASGVLLIGLALVLRDMVQRRLGRAAALTAIVAGALLSGAVAPPPLVYASAAAFLLSELADFAVYTPLQSRGLVLAVLASSLVGLVADSILFLWLAFGSLDFLAGRGQLELLDDEVAVRGVTRQAKVSACMPAAGAS